ncbi:glycine/D-amino acid oxidase-like deaminating enzyme [Bradyrhizobium sp. F1.13.1]
MSEYGNCLRPHLRRTTPLHGTKPVRKDARGIECAEFYTSPRDQHQYGSIPERASFTPHHDGVSIRTVTEEFFAERAILALGPWLGRALPTLGAVLNVTRQAVGWFKPTRPDTVALGRFPIFILDRGPNDVVYGFPDFEQRGVKAAPHNHGPVVGPDDWGPQATEAELRPVGDALAALVPGAAGPIIDRDVCLYTNTVPADRCPMRARNSSSIAGRIPA